MKKRPLINRLPRYSACISLYLFINLITSATGLKAQTIDVVIHNNGNQRKESIDLPEGMTYPIDSLLNDWKVKNYIQAVKDCSTANENPLFPDSIYIQRLSRIPSVMEMPYNDVVRKFIDMYATRLRNQVSFMLSASNFYVPIFEEALDAYNLPLELKYLPVIESALNPSATSRAGAAGLWQFMIGTAKIYGLEVNSLVDERRDPIKATWAAARYLKDLYNIYQDWNLVIAAYNCGPGNINKAIHRSGKNDYWSIYNYLPKETRGYVPAFIAANYLMTYYCDHNICPMETDIPASTDTIQVSHKLHFQQISDVCGISMKQLKSLNPQYRKQIIPGNIKPYTLRLPYGYIKSFINSQDTIYTHRANELFSKRKVVNISNRKYTRSRHSTPKGKRTYHKIRRGESLSTIAEKYHVRVKDIRRWNNLRNNNITAGKSLKIYK
nr:transglycosylase SLT domain-containing protein [uncultured Bacteroides sp.]